MSRRGNGEGTVTRRGDGRWQAGYSFTDETGRRRRRFLYAASQKQAAQALREALRRRDAGVMVTPGRETVEAFLLRWLDGIRPTIRPRSWERYEEHVRLHLSPTFGALPLGKLSPLDVQAALGALLAQGLSPATVRRAYATIRRALSQGVRWRLVAVNVADLVDPPRVSRREMAALSPDEARTLLRAVEGDPLEALYVLAVTAGLRQGELLALRWASVDLAAATLGVTGTLTRTRGAGLAITEPKSARSRRHVELSALAVESLRRHRLSQLERRVLAANVWEDHDLVFAGPHGGFLGVSDLGRRYRRVLARAGLRQVRFHDLRHTAATLLLGQGVHPKIVSEMLGHSTVAITLDLYSHVTPSMQRQAARTMDELLAGG